jgi:membrane-associated protein
LSTFLPLFITWWQQYGYPVIWLTIFVAAVGLPLPISLMMLAAGAFAATGDFQIVLLAIVAISASVSGDCSGYFLGRSVGRKMLARLERGKGRRFISQEVLARSQDYFKRRGGWAVFLSRFLFSGLGGITNFVAGIEKYPFPRFLLLDFLGETLGAIVPLLLGYAFGESWEAVGGILGSVSELLLALFCTAVLLYQVCKLIFRASHAHISKKEPAAAPLNGPVIPASLPERSEGHPI